MMSVLYGKSLVYEHADKDPDRLDRFGGVVCENTIKSSGQERDIGLRIWTTTHRSAVYVRHRIS